MSAEEVNHQSHAARPALGWRCRYYLKSNLGTAAHRYSWEHDYGAAVMSRTREDGGMWTYLPPH